MTSFSYRKAVAVVAVAIAALAMASTAAAQSMHLQWLENTTGVAEKEWPPTLAMWREISPTFGTLFIQHDRRDIDRDGEATDGDYVLLSLLGNGPIWYRVGWAGTICYVVNPGGGFLGYEVVAPNLPGSGPVGETWRPIYPVPNGTETVTGWTDTNLNTLLDPGDSVTLGATTYPVEQVGFAVVVEEGDPIAAEADSWGAVKNLYGKPAP